jgi:O-antigen/teichoic acid export membrane protein
MVSKRKLHNSTLINQLTAKGDQRSNMVKKNMLFSFLLKGISILISLLLVPLTLHYLNTAEYGIWLTLSSILSWISFFDIGLGNGLRNKLTEALSLGDKERAKTYVSTTFAFLFLIMIIFFIIFFFVNFSLRWDIILNTPSYMAKELVTIVNIVVAFFCMQFIFKTVGIIFISHQKTALSDLLTVSGSAFSLIIIYLLTLFTDGSLSYVAIAFSGAPTIIFVIAYIVVFYISQYRFLRPRLIYMKFSKSKDLIGLGVQFFIIHIAGLVMYTTSNIIITQILGPEQVTVYNIAYKYFSISIMLFTIIQAIMWSAYTDAWVRQDLLWIKRAIKRMLQLWLLFIGFSIFLFIVAPIVYQLWIGDSVNITYGLSLACAIWGIVNNWCSIWVNFINGVGKMKLQLYSSIVLSVLFIPLAIFFCKNFGIIGIVMNSILGMLPGCILSPIQFYKLINNTAKGIWNK